MNTYEVVVYPTTGGKFRDRGGLIKRATRTPLFEVARILSAQGESDDTQLTLRHEGSTIVAMSATVGRAKGLTVYERDKGTALGFAKFYPVGTNEATADAEVGDEALVD